MFPTDPIEYAQALVERHEAFRANVYWDGTGAPIEAGAFGNPTVGFGLNVGPSGGMTEGEARTVLWLRLMAIRAQVQNIDKWLASLSPQRQAVVLDVAYNVGVQGWIGFVETRAALQAGDFERAAAELLQSDAARLLPARYDEDARILATGKFPVGLYP